MKGTNITLGGKERVLRYDLNSIAEIGERLNITIRLSHIQEDLLDRPMPLGALRTLLWAGLIHAEPDLTETVVGGWVDTDNVGEVLQDFFAVFGMTSQDMPDPFSLSLGLDEGEEEETKEKKTG